MHPESVAERKEMLTVLCVHRWRVVGLWEVEGRCGDAAGQQREESLFGSSRSRSLRESSNGVWSKRSLESEGKKKPEASDAQLHTNQDEISLVLPSGTWPCLVTGLDAACSPWQGLVGTHMWPLLSHLDQLHLVLMV